MRTRSSPRPPTPPTSVSPDTTAATPSGVPEKIRSPGASSQAADRCSMVSPMFQISLETSLRWRSLPLTCSQISALETSPACAAGVIGPIGPDWS